MNPGFSVGELISAINLVWTVCKEFENATSELDSLREELKSLHDVLGKFQNEILRDDFRPCLASDDRDDRDDRAGNRTAYSDERGKLNILQREALADYMEEIRSNLFSLEKELELLGSNSKSKSDAQKLHPCTIQNCVAKPFTRLYDLYHIKTMHKDEERVDECSWPILLQRIQSDLDQCSKILSKGQRRRVCSTKAPKIEASPFNCRDVDDKNLRTYLFWRRITWLPVNNFSSRTSMYPRKCCEHLQCKSCSFEKWCLRLIAFTSMMAAMSMSASFFWLNQTANIEKPSNMVKWIISASMSVLPLQAVRSSFLVQQSSIIAFYLLSSALYSAVTTYWFIAYLRISSMNYWYIFGVSTTIIWILLGVTYAELFLVFLPLSVSVGICAQTLCGGLIVSPTDCKTYARVQDLSRKLTVYPMQLVQHQKFRKQDWEPYIQDLETACEADSGS